MKKKKIKDKNKFKDSYNLVQKDVFKIPTTYKIYLILYIKDLINIT